MPDQASRRSWCGAAVSSHLTSSRRQRLQRPRAGQPKGFAGRTLLAGRFARLGQLHRPGLLLSGIDLEKAGPVVAAGETIPGAPDGELLVACTHEGLA